MIALASGSRVYLACGITDIRKVMAGLAMLVQHDPVSTVARISSMLRGWCGYFDQGPVMEFYELIRAYTERRVRRWLMRRTGRQGVGFRQIPDEYLYETLGLYSVPRRRIDLPRAKV